VQNSRHCCSAALNIMLSKQASFRKLEFPQNPRAAFFTNRAKPCKLFFTVVAAATPVAATLSAWYSRRYCEFCLATHAIGLLSFHFALGSVCGNLYSIKFRTPADSHMELFFRSVIRSHRTHVVRRCDATYCCRCSVCLSVCVCVCPSVGHNDELNR